MEARKRPLGQTPRLPGVTNASGHRRAKPCSGGEEPRPRVAARPQERLLAVSSTSGGGVGCSRAVGECASNNAEHSSQTMACIAQELSSGATDCATSDCLASGSESEAEEFFLWQAAQCGAVCEGTEGFYCP